MEFYKATKANKGCGASFSCNAQVKDDLFCFFLNLIQQNGWNPKGNGGKGVGIFKGGKEATLKLSRSEVGLLISCLRYRRKIGLHNRGNSIYHATTKAVSTLDMTPWADKDDKTKFNGFTFVITRSSQESKDKDTFTLSLTTGEAEELRVWLEYGLCSIFDGMKSKKIKRMKEVKELKAKREQSSTSGGDRDKPPF